MQYLLVTGPILGTLSQVFFVRGMCGQDLHSGHVYLRLCRVRESGEQELLGVVLQALPLGGAFVGNELPRHGRVVGHEARIHELPKVHGRMVARGHPSHGGDD